ncbi:MDR/zinc-dependent alcohol dehydrogenase-like family protein [Candidatus Seribacter sulfatis]|uniref:hypothetical protein n=1 Tax=Candidatus Seribacter sulfatis TaxID=3381756 RepID=UPI00389AE6A3
MNNSLQFRTNTLLAESRQKHLGVFLTGPDRIELLSDELPRSVTTENDFVLASFGNCRCASDAKAIRQFDAHARVPSGVEKVALGHETLQLVLQAPAESEIRPGDIVVITPGHASQPINPLSFEPEDSGVLAALGYSYQYLGGLRRFNAVPGIAPSFIRSQGFGSLFNKVKPENDTSLISLAHAEPFACNFGTNKHIFTFNDKGEFVYGVPPRSILAYLSGTARMAMINLTIVASVPDSELPQVVYITGSPAKLEEMNEYALISDLRKRGTRVELIDRRDPAIISKLTEFGKPSVIWTNYASQESYDQACAIIEEGGNLNSYAGAADPKLVINMPIRRAEKFDSLEQEVEAQITSMHHNIGPNDPVRHSGLAKEPVVALLGFENDKPRLDAYLNQLPNDCPVYIPDHSWDGIEQSEAPSTSNFTDVFIAGHAQDAVREYQAVELNLARSAAVNFVDGDAIIPILSRQAHYVSRHQICGANVPWNLTNTSEPHSDDMVVHANNPVSFDWMVKGVCGLNHVTEMMEQVEATQPFGSFFAFTELPDLPYVEVNSHSFISAAQKRDGLVEQALLAGARILAENGEQWSREVEEAIYEGYNAFYPLNLKQ